MNDKAKIAIAFGTGVVGYKLAPDKLWWLLAGAGLLFFVNSPKARSAISSGAKSAYSSLRG
jgi:hypothetical protein